MCFARELNFSASRNGRLEIFNQKSHLATERRRTRAMVADHLSRSSAMQPIERRQSSTEKPLAQPAEQNARESQMPNECRDICKNPTNQRSYPALATGCRTTFAAVNRRIAAESVPIQTRQMRRSAQTQDRRRCRYHA